MFKERKEVDDKFEEDDLILIDNATKRMFKSIWELIPTIWQKKLWLILGLVILCLILTFFAGYYVGYGKALLYCNNYWQELTINTSFF